MPARSTIRTTEEDDMKTTIGLALAAALAATGLAARADEVRGPGACGGPGGFRGAGARLYDPKAMTTLAGEVAAVEQRGGRRGGGVRLEVKTSEGTLPVLLGPAWFLEEQGLRLAAGDQVEITGSKVAFRGAPAVIAQVVKKGEAAVALRDLNGIPVWARCGGR
jgi:hypothetical protein